MSIVSNEGKDVLVSYNYMLRVEGIYDLPCKAVHSFTKENEFEYLQEGGLNDYVHLLRKPVTKPFTFTVERYVGTDLIPPLPLGAELILPVILMVSPHPNRFDISKRTFVFTGCTVMSKTYGELNAEKSGLLTETIVIGYREMIEVTIPVHIGEDAQKWAFDGKNAEGNRVQSARGDSRQAHEKIPEQRYWAMPGSTIAKEAAKEQNDSATRVFAASAMEAPLENKTPEIRQWLKTDDAGIVSLVGTTSAHKRVQQEVTTDESTKVATKEIKKRKWEMNPKPQEDGVVPAAEVSAKAAPGEDEKPKIRQWPKISSAKKYTEIKET